MKIEIPESLFTEIIQLSAKAHSSRMVEVAGKVELVCEYGTYEVVPKPDIEYTEEVMKKVRVFKGEK